MPDPQTAEATPIGRIPDTTPGSQAASTAIPTLNPSDSPYTPLNLPTVDPKQVPIQEQQQPQPLGAVSRGGAIAYMADNILRGAMQGYNFAQQHKTDQLNKKLAAQKSIYEDQAKHFHELDHSPAAGTVGVGPDGKPMFIPSEEWKQAQHRVLASWQPLHQTVEDTLSPSVKGKAAKQQQKQEQAQGNELLQKAVGGDVSAILQLSKNGGPPVFYNSPTLAERKGISQAAQTAGTQATTAGVTADTAEKVARINNDLAAAVSSPVPTDPEQAKARQANIDRLTEARDTLLRSTAKPPLETADTRARADYEADKDPNKGSFEEWKTAQATKGRVEAAPPKPLKYDANTKSITDPATGKQWFGNELNMPASIASMFKGAKDAAFEKQQKALQLVAARGSAYLAGKVVQVVDPSDSSSTIYRKATDAIHDGDKTVGSVWYKLQMPTGTERARADLATSAREQLATMEDILQKRPDLFGPTSGRATDFTKWIGSQDPDAQRFAAAARIASDHLAGVFGGRSKDALEGIYNAIGQNKTNPAAAAAALEQMNIAAARIQGRGVGPIAPNAAPAAPPSAEVKPKHSLAKAMALPFNKGKTEAEVRSDLQSHGYEVIP